MKSTNNKLRNQGIIVLVIIGIITAVYFLSAGKGLQLMVTGGYVSPIQIKILKFHHSEGKNRLVYTLANNSPTGIITGEDYRLYRQANGNWVEKNDKAPAFRSIGYELKPSQTREFIVFLDLMTSDLQVGKYKLAKDYTLTDGSGSGGTAEVEFTLVKSDWQFIIRNWF